MCDDIMKEWMGVMLECVSNIMAIQALQLCANERVLGDEDNTNMAKTSMDRCAETSKKINRYHIDHS